MRVVLKAVGDMELPSSEESEVRRKVILKGRRSDAIFLTNTAGSSTAPMGAPLTALMISLMDKVLSREGVRTAETANFWPGTERTLKQSDSS